MKKVRHTRVRLVTQFQVYPPRVVSGVRDVDRLPRGGHQPSDAHIDGEPRLLRPGPGVGGGRGGRQPGGAPQAADVQLLQVGLLQLKHAAEGGLGALVDHEDTRPLALYEGEDVGQDPGHHLLQRALLLEDHPGKVQQHLVPLHLQQRPLVYLGVPQPETTEL